MSEDKRNHPRAKVLSMTVRYKSATVDEFVEHHSDNVSRGGIFIKTTQPFPPGTLLKFEIRIAADEAVLSGVGRVVWRRDEVGDNEEEPAGMGVKFIKLDEKSRSLIARLVDRQDGEESKYERGLSQEKAKAAGKPAKKGTLL
ncbi:MAG: TIGR02266 family protein, partial [Myxococcota bacterium]